MTQYKVNKAYPALKRLGDLRLPIQKARLLYAVTKKAEDLFQFAVQEENKYISEYHGTLNQDGTVTFDSQENFGKFQDKLAELNDSEIEWDLSSVEITEDDIGQQGITAADIFNLEGFVSFI